MTGERGWLAMNPFHFVGNEGLLAEVRLCDCGGNHVVVCVGGVDDPSAREVASVSEASALLVYALGCAVAFTASAADADPTIASQVDECWAAICALAAYRLRMQKELYGAAGRRVPPSRWN